MCTNMCLPNVPMTSLCFSPGPRENPGCTGQCQLTVCHACYFSEKVRDLPGECSTCGSPVSSLKCLREWATCIHRSDITEKGKVEPPVCSWYIKLYHSGIVNRCLHDHS